MKFVARCEKCGREFLTMPKDGRDAYLPANERVTAFSRPCGGEIKPVPAALEAAKAKRP